MISLFDISLDMVSCFKIKSDNNKIELKWEKKQ